MISSCRLFGFTCGKKACNLTFSLKRLIKPNDFLKSEWEWQCVRSAVTALKNNEERRRILSFEDIPGPTDLPLIRSAWLFLPGLGGHTTNHFDVFMEKLYNDYGPIVKLKLPFTSMVWLFDPDDIRTVYHNEGKYPVHTGIEPLKAYRATQKRLHGLSGLTSVNGEEWYELRSRIQRHMLHIPTVESYIPKMKELTDDFLEQVQHLTQTQGVVNDIIHLLQTWAIQTVCYVTLNIKLDILKQEANNNSDSVRLKKAAVSIFDALGKTTLGSQLWRVYPTKDWKELVQSHSIFTDLALKFIDQALKESKTTNEEDMSLLETFLKRQKMKPEHAVIMAMDLLLAGVDTTSGTASFLLYNLARNPEAQEKLFKEVSSELGVNEKVIKPESIRRMEFLRACVKETLRLNPIVIGTSRILDVDVVLSNYRVPAKMPMLMSTMTVMRQEKYFKNADKFLPERWLGGSIKHHPFAYLPFGHGPRTCIGRRVAQQELHILISQLIRHFYIECDIKDIGRVTGLTSRPDQPLNLRFVPRT